jgi:hypothetical protein
MNAAAFARWLAGYRAGVPVAAMAGGPPPGCRTRGSRGLARA